MSKFEYRQRWDPMNKPRTNVMKTTARLASILVFCLLLVVSVLAAPAYAETSRDVSGYDTIIQNSLNTHCTECHDQETQKGKVRLDNWRSLQEAKKLSLLDRAMEQVFHEVMPPKKKNALTADQQKTLFDAINQRHVITQTKSEFNEKLSEKLKRPGYGNYLDHGMLFFRRKQGPSRIYLRPRLAYQRIHLC